MLIFSDPAAMGLFFMGAIVMLEQSFAVSPLKVWEYVGSKVLSLSMIGLLVAGLVGVTARQEALPQLLLGISLASV